MRFTAARVLGRENVLGAEGRPSVLAGFAAALRRPGPPPQGWVPAAALILSGTAAGIAALAVAGWVLRNDPGRGFHEQQPGTLMSVALLLAAAVLGVRAVCIRPPAGAAGMPFFWLMLAAALVFLAADEWWMFHERVDFWLHGLVGADPENPVTDHLDDAIVGVYGAALAGAAWFRRDALLRSPWFVRCALAGGVLFAFMVAVDMLTDTWVVAEEGAKLMAEAFLVAGLLALTGVPAALRLPRRRRSTADA